MSRLEGKKALITGAAKGQGEAMARVLLKHGAIVILEDLSEKGKETAEKLVDEEGGIASFIQMNVSRADDWKKTIVYI